MFSHEHCLATVCCFCIMNVIGTLSPLLISFSYAEPVYSIKQAMLMANIKIIAVKMMIVTGKI
jgi:hypothetical protein